MDDTDFTPEEQAANTIIPQYNILPYNAVTNKYGFGEYGQRYNYLPLANQVSTLAKAGRRFALFASAQAILAGQEADNASAERIAAQNAADNSYSSAQNSLTQANRSSTEADRAGTFASGLNLPAISTANAFQFLQVKPDGSGYRTTTIEIPPILPITMTAPASGATDVGAGGTYTFVARAFAGDTTGFYSNYGVPVASRFVNVYEPGGTVPVKTFTAAGGGPSLFANFIGSGLVVSHAYQFEFGYTDQLGNTVKSPKVSATTASQFKPSEGQAYQGGFLGFQNFGDGDLFDLVVAPKSTEASKVFSQQASSGPYGLSRLNGLKNTLDFIAAQGSSGVQAAGYTRSFEFPAGTTGYLGAIDELRAISSKLNPNVAVEAAFKSGGAESFTAGSGNGHWSSTEVSTSVAFSALMNLNQADPTSQRTKTESNLVRAIKRVSTIAPYPIGTAMEGGYLAAYFTDLSSGSPVTYMLIVADKATEVTRAWATGNSSVGYMSRTNGAQYTTESAGYPAFAYANGLASGGKTDWYLGAIDEMLTILRMNSQLPSGQRLTLDSNGTWTSTENDVGTAKYISSTISEATASKTSVGNVRPIRRVLLPAT